MEEYSVKVYDVWYQDGERYRKELTGGESNNRSIKGRYYLDYGDLTEEQYDQFRRKYVQEVIDGACGGGISLVKWIELMGYKHEGRGKFKRIKEQDSIEAKEHNDNILLTNIKIGTEIKAAIIDRKEAEILVKQLRNILKPTENTEK